MAERTAVYEVCVRRTIAAPAQEVFNAWLDADVLAQWMKTRAFTHVTTTCDAREGGAFEIVMHAPAEVVRHTGRYITIDRPSKLIFTWCSPSTEHNASLVTVEFFTRGESTEIVVTHRQLPSDASRSHEEGWNDVLKLLADLFQAGVLDSPRIPS